MIDIDKLEHHATKLIMAMRNEKLTQPRSLNVREAQQELADLLGIEWQENKPIGDDPPTDHHLHLAE